MSSLAYAVPAYAGIGAVILAIVLAVLAWWRRDITARARAEMQERAEHYARQAEDAMDAEMLERRDPDKTTEHLRHGRF